MVLPNRYEKAKMFGKITSISGKNNVVTSFNLFEFKSMHEEDPS